MKKVFLSVVCLAILFTVTTASASPFLSIAPYTKGSNQPIDFAVVINGTTYTVPATDFNLTQVYFKMDLAGKILVTGAGDNTITVKARNMFSMSSVSLPLSFNALPPVAPSGLILSAD